MILGRNWQILMTGAHIHGHQLERVSKFHYLGVLFDENLTWKEQVGDIAFKASKRLGLMARIRFCFAGCMMQPGESSRKGAKTIYSVSRIEVHE